jgi:hypothetical protein
MPPARARLRSASGRTSVISVFCGPFLPVQDAALAELPGTDRGFYRADLRIDIVDR